MSTGQMMRTSPTVRVIPSLIVSMCSLVVRQREPKEVSAREEKGKGLFREIDTRLSLESAVAELTEMRDVFRDSNGTPGGCRWETPETAYTNRLEGIKRPK